MNYNWDLCFICQEKKSEPLKFPQSPHAEKDSQEIYHAFICRYHQFQELEALPVTLPTDICHETVLHKSNAKWHKSCYNKFANEKLERAKKKRERTDCDCEYDSCSKRLKRECFDKKKCIFCSKEDGVLHECRTLSADDNIRQMAIDLGDAKLLARTQGGYDIIASEAKYHLACLTECRNRRRSIERQHISSLKYEDEKLIEAEAFTKLVNDIETQVECGSQYLFKFSNLHVMYIDILESHKVYKEINRNRLKQQILYYFPQAQEQNDGRYSILAFPQGMRTPLKDYKNNETEKANFKILSDAATIVRKSVFNFHSNFNFDGAFSEKCQSDSIPDELKILISMI